jgi:septal ring factor EnvC (AmiA/AmiB activator)
MDPITITVITAILSGGLGGVIGFLFGKSDAEKKIEALILEITRLVEINQRREKQIMQLTQEIETLKSEIQKIKKSRSIIMRFIYWIIKEQPQVIELYNSITIKKDEIETNQEEINRNLGAIETKIDDATKEYPEQMGKLIDFINKN